MRLRLSTQLLSRIHRHHGHCLRFYSSPSLAARLQEMRHRPAKVISDYLVPMPSHLLETTLSDLVGSSATTTTTISSSTISSPPRILSPGHHLVYFPIQAAPSALAPDGADLTHFPGAPFHRRMWAGGEIQFHQGWERDLLLDARPWVCREEIGDARAKGKEGEEKVFVDVWRRYGTVDSEEAEEQKWQIEERRTLVFMRPLESDGPVTPRTIKHPLTPIARYPLLPTAKHLFNFSALTYNAHSIHLDPESTRSHNGHRNLLVHGPLCLALMLRAVTHQTGPEAVQSIEYRNLAPLYVDEPMSVCVAGPISRSTDGDRGQKWDTWVEGPTGGMSVRGTVTTA